MKQQNNQAGLNAKQVYIIAAAGIGFFTTLVFTLNLVYHVKTVGLDPLQLVLVGTILELSTFLFEIPTGLVADLYSRRLSTIIGFFVIGLGFLIEGLFPIFGAILIAQVVWGLGYTFISGAFDAWITDEVGSENVGSVFIRASQAQMAVTFLAIPVSVLLGNVLINLPIIIGGGLFILMAFWLIVVMKETNFTPVSHDEHINLTTLWTTFQQSLVSLKGNRAVTQFLGVMLFIGLASEAYDRMNTAHFLTNFKFPQPLPFVISDQSWFGILGFSSALISLLISEVVRKKMDLKQHRRVIAWLIGVSLLTSAGILLFALSKSVELAIFAFLVITISRSIVGPVQNAWINQHIESKYRATTLSLSSQVNAFGQIGGGPVLGWVGKRFSITAALVISGLLHLGPVHFFRKSFQDVVVLEENTD